jgi:hypothetical protein
MSGKTCWREGASEASVDVCRWRNEEVITYISISSEASVDVCRWRNEEGITYISISSEASVDVCRQVSVSMAGSNVSVSTPTV